MEDFLKDKIKEYSIIISTTIDIYNELKGTLSVYQMSILLANIKAYENAKTEAENELDLLKTKIA